MGVHLWWELISFVHHAESSEQERLQYNQIKLHKIKQIKLQCLPFNKHCRKTREELMSEYLLKKTDKLQYANRRITVHGMYVAQNKCVL